MANDKALHLSGLKCSTTDVWWHWTDSQNVSLIHVFSPTTHCGLIYFFWSVSLKYQSVDICPRSFDFCLISSRVPLSELPFLVQICVLQLIKTAKCGSAVYKPVTIITMSRPSFIESIDTLVVKLFLWQGKVLIDNAYVWYSCTLFSKLILLQKSIKCVISLGLDISLCFLSSHPIIVCRI